MLWALHFMKNYPKQQGGCASAGGSSGAIDPKTYSKYLWPFIDAIAYLEQHLVSDVLIVYQFSFCYWTISTPYTYPS